VGLLSAATLAAGVSGSAPPSPRLDEAEVPARGHDDVIARQDADEVGRGAQPLREVDVVG
jgi:hypothetical protein